MKYILLNSFGKEHGLFTKVVRLPEYDSFWADGSMYPDSATGGAVVKEVPDDYKLNQLTN